jgi:hypothetical protein
VHEAEQVLRSAYRAFNARDLQAALDLMHPEVDWPNAWQGGRLAGRGDVGEYWARQFSAISSTVEPESFTEEPDGAVTVAVHQVVHDAHTGELLSDSRVCHRYRLAGGLVMRMDVLGSPNTPLARTPPGSQSRSGLPLGTTSTEPREAAASCGRTVPAQASTFRRRSSGPDIRARGRRARCGRPARARCARGRGPRARDPRPCSGAQRAELPAR